MKKYYSEQIEKDTRYRAEYLDLINEILQAEKVSAENRRSSFISPKKYKENPDFYTSELIKTLGFPLNEKRIIPTMEKTFVARDGNVNIYRTQFAFGQNFKFYGIYFEQVENSKTAPFVFAFHGGSGTPEIVSSIYLDSANYNHLARRISDKGANVFAPQLMLWDQNLYGNNYNRAYVDGKLRQLGGSITALELYLLQCILDCFLQSGSINQDKIGVAGLSYGGMYALHFTAIEKRIKACYSCSWVNDCFVHSWPDWSYFNAQSRFTTIETMGIIAPRPLVVAMGDKDELFAHELTLKVCTQAKEYYSEFGCENKFKCIIFDGRHEADKSDEELTFLLENL